MRSLYFFVFISLFAFNSLNATDMSTHLKKYNYRGEIEMPTLASNIQELLGVPHANWSTFGPSYYDCPRLNKWVSKDQEYFASQNARKSKKYLTNNIGEKYTIEESEIETTFYSCLSEIRFIKNQIVEFKKYEKKLIEIDFPRLQKRHPGFNTPKVTLNGMIEKNIDKKVIPSKKDIYFIAVYGNNYVIQQKLDKNTGLFYDKKGNWPSLYFIAPSGRSLKEGISINDAADYYTFEGVYSYKNIQGFDRQAYIIRGYIDEEFREDTISYFYNKQWLIGINTDGMWK